MMHKALTREQAKETAGEKDQSVAAPPGCPSLARIYRAILREDWTEAELACFAQSLAARQVRERVRRGVWYPPAEALFRQAHGLPLRDDERVDLTHHLEVDRCRRSLRLLRFFRRDDLLNRLWRAAKDGTTAALSRFHRTVASVTTPTVGLLRPLPERAIPEHVIFDDDLTTAVRERVIGRPGEMLTLRRTAPDQDAVRLAVTDAEGEPVQHSLVPLTPGPDGFEGCVVLPATDREFWLVCSPA